MGVSIAQLKDIIYQCPPIPGNHQPQRPFASGSDSSFRLNVRAYLEKYGIEYIKEKRHGNSTLYVLENCVFDESHVGGESAIGQCDDGLLFYQCFHDSCQGKKWSDARRLISGEAPLVDGRPKAAGKAIPDDHGNHDREVPDSPLSLVKRNEESLPFPFEALGPTMSAACEAIQDGIQAPDAIIAQSILGAANLAVQGHAKVLIDGRVFPLSLFLLSIAGTGERKSAVDGVALARHREIEKGNIKRMTDELELYELGLAAYEQEKDAVIKAKSTSLEEKRSKLERLQRQKPQKPLDQTILVTDFTFEGLFKLFLIGVPSKGLFADEGGQVTGGHGMKKESILATAAGLSKFWDGARVDRIRVIDGFSHLYGRRLSVHLMMQDHVGLSFYANDTLRDQGLISRFLVAWPSSTVGTRPYKAVNVTDSSPMTSFYNKVSAAMTKPLRCRDDSGGQELDPPVLHLSPEAKRMWEQCYNSIEAQSARRQPLVPVRGLANKAAEHAVRIAGTIQLFEDPDSVEINADSMRCGIMAIEWYLDEALRIAGSFSPDTHLMKAREVLRWIHDNEMTVITLPDIYQFSPVRTASEARKAVEVLLAHNHLLRPSSGQPRKPVVTRNGKTSREWWEVHPESNRNFCEE